MANGRALSRVPRVDTRPLLVLDADDTLWSTGPLHNRAREAGAAIIAALVPGIDPVLWAERQVEIDMSLVPVMHLSKRQFPTSFVRAYDELTRESGGTVDPDVSAALYQAGESVFSMPAELIRGVPAAIATLNRTHRLVLLTKGDDEVQKLRVAASGLAHYFIEVVVVGKKTEGDFLGICARHNVRPQDTWTIGNSVPSDLNPALRVGMQAIWIPAPNVWKYEEREEMHLQGSAFTVSKLQHVPFVLNFERQRQARLDAQTAAGITPQSNAGRGQALAG